MMKKGFRDWNQAVGTSKLPIMRSVYSWAYRFIRPPACSKPAQKMMVNRPSTRITLMRSTSCLVRALLLLGALQGGTLGSGHTADVAKGNAGPWWPARPGEQHADTGADEGGLPAIGGGGGAADHAGQQGPRLMPM